MSTLYICPLEKLDETIKLSKAQNLLCLTGPEQEIERPKEITRGFAHLVFNDITEPRSGLIEPNKEHIKTCIEAFREWEGEIICCCWMGVSRSVAAAVIGCATRYPQLKGEVIAKKLRENAPFANPNLLMIEIADKQLERNGELINAFAKLAEPEQINIGTPFSIKLNIKTHI